MAAQGQFGRAAECNSAIRQIENLRYEEGGVFAVVASGREFFVLV